MKLLSRLWRLPPTKLFKKYLHSNVPNISHTEVIKTGVLENASEDLSSVVSHLPPSYNLAAYVNHSDILQNLIHLDVNLSKIEKKPYIAEKILKIDLDILKAHIIFLKDYVDPDDIGQYITKNPLILLQPLEDLDVRINYLKSKSFTSNQIQRIVSNNPFWLMFSTFRIDKRLGFYQKSFHLTGDDVRSLASKQPRIITYNVHHIKTNTFVIKEEMGFSASEIKRMLLEKPRLWMINQKSLLERFNYIHNVLKIPHRIILRDPGVLLCRNFKLKQRHLFLQKLGRAQYDPKKENYVPIKALVEQTDIEFCEKYAKCGVSDFNLFLKTL